MAKKKSQVERAIDTLLAQKKELEWKFTADIAGIDAAIKVLEAQQKKAPRPRMVNPAVAAAV